MPPLDWSIVQSILLTLVLPSLGIAAGLSALLLALVQTESGRSIAVPIGLMAGLIGGLAVQNSRGELIPFVSIERTTSPVAADDMSSEAVTEAEHAASWKFETGWRSLFSVTMLAMLGDILIEIVLGSKQRPLLSLFARGVVTVACALWLMPWDDFHSRPAAYVLLSLVILLNGIALRQVDQLAVSRFVALALAIVWGGSSTALMVLAHSARFADLAMLFSCAMAGVGIVMLFKHQTSPSLYAGPATFIPGLMLSGQLNTYSDIPNLCFWLIALAPGSFIILIWPKCAARLRAYPIVLFLSLCVPCGTAVALAIRAEF